MSDGEATTLADAEKPVCPECASGKHGNCSGTAWSELNDLPTKCTCWANGHEED